MRNFNFIVFIFLTIWATSLQAQSTTELVRGAKEMTPSAYYDLSQEAERLYLQKNYPKAAEAYEKLTNAYPWDGEKWQALAFALYVQGKFREAIEPFLKADEFGISVASHFNAYYIAKSYARAGDTENALIWLEKTVGQLRFNNLPNLANDPAFASLKNNPRFIKLTGALPNKNFTRDQGWQYDVDYLLSEVKRVNPVYSKQPFPDDLTQAADRLKQQIPVLSDARVLLEMQHLLVLLRQSHNNVLPSPKDKLGKLTQLPVTFYIFPEGLFIVDAVAPYEDLIGSRVLKFDNTTAENALDSIGYVISGENKMEIAWKAPDRLKIVQWLHALKITSDPDRVDLTVLDRKGKTRKVSPQPIALAPRQKLNAPHLADLPQVPLYLSRPDDNYWFEYLPKDKTIFLQYNQVEDKEGKEDESLEKFGLRLRDFLAKNEVRNLIVDVRRNNGGSTFTDAELLRTLIKFDADKDNRLFVFIGRWTFSAASNFITDVDRLTRAVFVGEPSGGKPLMVGGDESPFILPFSGVTGALSSTSWQLTSPRDSRLWITPDIPVQLTAEDYFANRDPLIEIVLTMINKK
jgi:tetratricopeptide (TPR) repeat protein